MIDLKELRWLAEKATQGKWIAYQQGNSVPSHCVKSRGKEFGAGLKNVCGSISPKTGNADYISAVQPDIMIELLDRLEAAEKVCASLFTDFCEWQLDVDALKEWQDKYEKQYESEQEVKRCADQQQKKS